MRHRLLVAEALVVLGLARVGIAVLPFRWWPRFFMRDPNRPERKGDARQAIVSRVRRAIVAAARRLPGETRCFLKDTNELSFGSATI